MIGQKGSVLIERDYEVDADGCWMWLGSIDRGGYGAVSHPVTHRWVKAHRLSYEVHKGRIPAGLHLDHLCRKRACINPDHLEPVTSRENTLRGASIAAEVVRTNRCTKGHELTEENTYYRPDGRGRSCRICKRALLRAWRAKRAAPSLDGGAS